MAAASFLHSTTAQPVHSSSQSTSSSRGVRFPAWAFARRISNNNNNNHNRRTGCQDMNHNPKDSFSKIRQLQHHVQQAAQGSQARKETSHEIVTQTTLDTVSSAESPAEMTTTTTTLPSPSGSSTQLLLQLDVTGVSVEDLRVHVDSLQKQLVVVGMGARMFKRKYPLPPHTNVPNLKATWRKSESGQYYLTLVEQRPVLANNQSSVTGEGCYRLSILPQETS